MWSGTDYDKKRLEIATTSCNHEIAAKALSKRKEKKKRDACFFSCHYKKANKCNEIDVRNCTEIGNASGLIEILEKTGATNLKLEEYIQKTFNLNTDQLWMKALPQSINLELNIVAQT